MSENVNHPNHYARGRIEVAVAMDVLGDPSQWLGHALKYACRACHKGKEIEDLEKAIWCAEHALKLRAQWPARLSDAAREALACALFEGVDTLGVTREHGRGVLREALLELRYSTRRLIRAIVSHDDDLGTLQEAVKDVRSAVGDYAVHTQLSAPGPSVERTCPADSSPASDPHSAPASVGVTPYQEDF